MKRKEEGFFLVILCIAPGCAGPSLLRGFSLAVVRGLLIVVASLAVRYGPEGAGPSAAAAHGLSSWGFPGSRAQAQ